MDSTTFKRTAVAALVFGSLTAAQSAAALTVTVDATDNIYYTGAIPSDFLPNDKLNVSGTNADQVGVYTGGRMALDDYPAWTPPRCKQILDPSQYDGNGNLLEGAVEPPDDTELLCYGSDPVVVDLASFPGASLKFRIPQGQSVKGFPAYGALDAINDDNNGQPAGAVIGMFVSDDYDLNENGTIDSNGTDNEAPYWDSTGVLLTYNGISTKDGGLGSLEDYGNATPETALGEMDQDDDGHLDDSAIVQGWRTNFPGFRQLTGEYEFALVGNKLVDGYYERTVAKPAGATHLILGFNVEPGIFDSATTDSFTVEITDVAASVDQALEYEGDNTNDANDTSNTGGSGGGGGSLSWLLGLGLMLPAFMRRRLAK